MRVFITGATGLVGSAVVAELLSHGHTVLALVRSDASEQAAVQAGAETVRGTLADLDVLREGAVQADGVIHLAFGHDFSSAEAVAASVAEETAALEALGEALVGSNKPFVTVAGTPAAAGRPSTEADELAVEGLVGGRSRAVVATVALADRGVRTAAVRLPRTVHNNGDGGFAGLLAIMARAAGVVTFPGDGSQRWPAVHAADAAVLFRLALEKAEPGTHWHAVADEGDQVQEIAAVIGRRLDVPVKAVSVEEFGPLGQIFATDQPSVSTHTRETLGWEPTHPSLLADLENLQP